MTEDPTNIIIIPNSALFDLGVSVGFGAITGGFLAIGFYLVCLSIFDICRLAFKARAARRGDAA